MKPKKGAATLKEVAAKKPQHVVESEERIKILTKNLYEAVNKSAEEMEGNVSFFELTDAFLRVSHSYNTRALKSQYDDDGSKKQ